MPKDLSIFLSYSHQDTTDCKVLEEMLRMQENQGVKLWRDDQIRPGVDWDNEIKDQLNRADIVIFVLSKAFLASTYIPENEFQPALKKRVIPVVLEDCEWRTSEVAHLKALARLQALPAGAKPIKDKDWPNPAQPYIDVAKGIRKVFTEVSGEGEAATVSRSLAKMADLGTHPEVKTAITDCIAQFRTSSDQIALVADYKAVHDILHVLQFQCLATLRDAAPDFPDNARAAREVGRYEVILRAQVQALVEVAKRRVEPDIQTCLEYLQIVIGLLAKAVKTDDRKPLLDGLEVLGPLLSQFPPKIAARLDQAAEALRLPDLVRAMESIAAQIEQIGVESSEAEDVRSGAGSLRSIDENLTKLVDEHKRWQVIDTEMRMASAALETNFAGTFKSLMWPKLRSSLLKICDGVQEDWASQLKTDIGKLEDPEADSARFTRVFPRIEQQAGERFFRVDDDLKQLTESVRTIDRPLQHLLDTTAHA